jgi:hypothetical protein
MLHVGANLGSQKGNLPIILVALIAHINLNVCSGVSLICVEFIQKNACYSESLCIQ